MSLAIDTLIRLRSFHRLFALVAATAALVLCFTSPPALAKDGQVTVQVAGITLESVTVKLNELGANDINNREYRLKDGPVTISGHSLRQIMVKADAESEAIDLETIPSVTIEPSVEEGSGGTSGRPIRISGDDVRDPEAFPDGPPVFYEDNGATVFVMPGTTSGASGSRARYANVAVGIKVNTADFDVELSASRNQVKVGQKVTFRAKVSGQEVGENLSFSWNFNDGGIRTTTAGRTGHTFTSKGSYPVILNVTGLFGSGRSGILIEVDGTDEEKDPEKKPEGNEGTGGENGGSGGTGDGFGGGTGGFGTGTGTGFPGVVPGPVTPAAPAPAIQTPAPAPQPEPEPEPDPPVDDGLVEVQGELVDPLGSAAVVGPERCTGDRECRPGGLRGRAGRIRYPRRGLGDSRHRPVTRSRRLRRVAGLFQALLTRRHFSVTWEPPVIESVPSGKRTQALLVPS